MASYALYLLPALAIFILIEESCVSVKGNLAYRSRRIQRRIRNRVLFFRALVVALILATLLTKAWPMPSLPEIVQGVLFTLIMMAPVCLYILISNLWFNRQLKLEAEAEAEVEQGNTDALDLRAAAAPLPVSEAAPSSAQPSPPDIAPAQTRQPDPAATESQQAYDAQTAPLQADTAQAQHQRADERQKTLRRQTDEILQTSPQLKASTTTEQSQPADKPSPQEETTKPADKHSATSLHNPAHEQQESALDQTLSVGEQLETLDELVDFHDIGDDRFGAPGSDDPKASFAENPLEKAIAVAREGILEEPGIQDYSTENLPAKSRIELSEMVVRLRNDKRKLQKLVIAQKAVIDSEKQAHERTRVVVKDAISVMRHARHGQRIAEKIARRERAQRQRLEKDYLKVQRQLDNALSTLKPEQRQEVEKET